ncbi:MAG TPA: hypothetical protein VNS09_22500 [Solirubrobacter sp.]|nr:hypothetical protein [Solirubrobacter sp.]
MVARPRVLLAAVIALFAAGCGGASDEPVAQVTATATPWTVAQPTVTAAATPEATPVGKDCSQVGDLTATAKRMPPDDVRLLDYAHFYKSVGTRRFYAVLDGEPSELPSRRDDAMTYMIQSNLFEQLDADDKPGVSTAKLRGELHRVDLRVTALCDGKIGIRYSVRKR